MSEPNPLPTPAISTTNQQPLSQPVGVLHEIRWQEICPGLILVKALRVSLLLRVLAIAWVGVMLTGWGWGELSQRFALGSTSNLQEAIDTTTRHLDAPTPERLDRPATGSNEWFPAWLPKSNPFLHSWQWLSEPFLRVLHANQPWRNSLGWMFCGLWAITIWGIFGGAISRIAALYLTRGETQGPIAALRDAITIWPGTTGAPLIPLLAAVALAVPLVLLGLLLRLNVVAAVAGLLWVVVLAWGLMLAVISLGLLVGWPLMWACLGVERSDAFDGVSRCYAYVYQKPLPLACYVVAAALLGLLGEGVVTHFVAATIALSEWALSWGSGNLRAAELLDADWPDAAFPLSTRAIDGWRQALKSTIVVYPLACLWPMSVGIYLLLRRSVDATEMEEVTLSSGLQAPDSTELQEGEESHTVAQSPSPD